MGIKIPGVLVTLLLAVSKQTISQHFCGASITFEIKFSRVNNWYKY